MYKLIIVDDEVVIRNGIRDFIDWKSLDFEVANTFEDGKEALEYLRTHEIDVVLTDIEMVEVSGLELAKQLQQNQIGSEIKTKVVIISGYKEFEYARKAVEYGVEHYLLKPIRMEEVSEVFLKIAEDLNNLYESKNSKIDDRNNFIQLLPEIQEQFWINLLIGNERSEEYIDKRIKAFSIEVNKEYPFAVVNVKVNELKAKMKNYYREDSECHLIRNICSGNFDELISFPVFLEDGTIKLIITTIHKDDIETFRKHVLERLEERKTVAQTLLKVQFYFEIENIFINIRGLAEHQYNYKNKGNKIEYLKLSDVDDSLVMEKYILLMDTVNSGDFIKLDNVLDRIFFEFRKMPIEQVQHLCIDMFSMLSAKLMKMGIDLWKVWNRNMNYQEILSTYNLLELKEKVKSQLHEAIEMISRKQNLTSKDSVDEAVKYMKSHYSEDISLEIVAKKVHLNPTYLSRIFKQYTGNTFTDYLIELRMEQAKILLEMGKYKVYQVSQMVGYQSEKYFFRIFKQYTGCSPTEYYRGNM